MAATDEHSVRLTGPGGASATIAYLGATVCSFIREFPSEAPQGNRTRRLIMGLHSGRRRREALQV